VRKAEPVALRMRGVFNLEDELPSDRLQS